MPIIKNLSALALRQGFRKFDDVQKLGGFPFCDELDYLYFDGEEKFDAELIRNGEKRVVKVKKRADQPLGLEFDFDMKPERCKNNCVFCFVSQLPPGMRDTLYVKDDDYRFSFISGSYVTLTNVSDGDIDRIIRLKLSPLYISVHAFDDDIRVKLIKNPNTKKLIPYMRRLGEAGIKMHTQLVIVPGMNDGEVLRRSIEGLRGIIGVESVAVVPVGLTGHRDKLTKLRAVGAEEAKETIELVEKLNDKYGGFCRCSDEYYVKAGLPVREYGYYGDFSQLENGVGLIADFEDNLSYALDTAKRAELNLKLAFVTGTSFAPLLEEYVKPLESHLGVKITVVPAVNEFFGDSVTVAGLLTAADILKALGKAAERAFKAGEPPFDAVVLPDNMLREFTDTFLDNVSVKELEGAAGMPALIAAHNGSDLPEIISEFGEKYER